MFYTIQNDRLLTAENEQALIRFYDNVLPLPIDYEQGKYIVVDGELVLNSEWDNINLQNAKKVKIQQNDSIRDNALVSGVTYNNILFDSDTDQKANILGAVLQMSDTDTIEWFGMNNDSLICTKQDLINIGGLITELHSFVWNKNAQIKELINNAQTIEEVNAIEIDYNIQ